MTQKEHSHIKIAITDLNGVMRAKFISKAKFDKALDAGFGFCDVIVGSDIDDQLIDNLHYTGWQTGYPDALVNIVPESERRLPYENNVPLYLCEFDSSNAQICPRQTLKHVVKKGHELGFKATCGMEFEFTLFNEDVHSVHDKQFKSLEPLTPANCGYSMLRSSMLSDFYLELLETCEQMNITLEGLHTEIGPGVLEAAIAKAPIVEAADKAALFKTVVKTLAHQRGWMATFMAKWSLDFQGQSGHIHLSIKDNDDATVFYDDNQQDNISETMRHVIGGQQIALPELLLLSTPFVNSFRRLVPGFWAPTQASWGVDNRTTAIRAITGSPSSQRIEYRIPGADCNPYLGMSAALASALYGIQNKIEPTKPMVGNAYEQTMPQEYILPSSLIDCAKRFRQSDIAKAWFDDKFIEDYATTREWEALQHQKAITDWQLQRYFELA